MIIHRIGTVLCCVTTKDGHKSYAFSHSVQLAIHIALNVRTADLIIGNQLVIRTGLVGTKTFDISEVEVWTLLYSHRNHV